MEAQKIIDIFLPDPVSQAFDVANMHSDSLRIDICLDEKKIVLVDMRNKHLLSHGFTSTTAHNSLRSLWLFKSYALRHHR